MDGRLSQLDHGMHGKHLQVEEPWGDAAGGKGTGGTGIMSFLKPVRNRTRAKIVMHSTAGDNDRALQHAK